MEEQTERLAASIIYGLRSLSAVSPNRCIYRVPEHLRQVNEKAYRPMVVSIGPFYFQDPQLRAMQDQKPRYLKAFVERGKSDHTSLKNYISFVREREHEAREYYAEEVSLSSDDFIRMLLLDAAFIIEVFHYALVGSEVVEQNIVVYNQVSRDLFLEENQVPFFILEGLYDLAFCTTYSNNLHLSFIQFVSQYFCTYLEFENETTCQKISKASTTIRHLVDCLRICYLPSTLREKHLPHDQKFQLPMSASKLSSAGVKFVASKSKNLLDVRITRKGVLEIPKFRVEDATESEFRSIMLLEQCHYYFDSYFIDYIIFLNRLINSRKDVQILVENEIMDNCVGSNEQAAHLFNNVVKNITLYPHHFYYNDVSADLNKYAATPWNRWKAILKSNYFNHPWSVISVIYAVVILILTVLQAITGFTSKN